MKNALCAIMMCGLATSMTGAAGCVSDPGAALDGSDVDVGETISALAGTDPLSQVAVRFTTGSDDKRSDSQVFYHVTINGFDHLFSAGGTGATWSNSIPPGWFITSLPPGTRNQDISNFFVTWQQGKGGFIQTGDNWNLQQVEIQVFDTNPAVNTWVVKGSPSGNPLQRFTGSVTSWSWGGWPL